MKKRILLIAFAITVFTIGSVNAATPSTTVSGSIGHPTGESSNVGGHESKTWTLNVNGQQYSAYCIDPGAGLAGSVSCEMLQEGNYPMIYKAATDPNLSEDEKNAVFRTLGIMERQSNLFTESGNIGEFNRNDINVRFTASWHQALINYPGFDPGPMDPINVPYVDSDLAAALAPYVGLWVDKYFGSGTGGGGGAGGGGAGGSTGAASTAGNSGVFTATPCGGTVEKPQFCVNGPANATDVTISGINNTMISVDQPYSGGQARFTVLSCKNAQVAITGVVPGGTGANNTPYLCTGAGSSQSYVAMMGGASRDVINLAVTCPPCIEQRDPIPEKISPPGDTTEIDASAIQGTGDIHLCCDSPVSELKEPELDGLFTGDNNTYYNLTHYSNKCNNNGFKDTGSNGLMNKLVSYVNSVKQTDADGIDLNIVSRYCNIYCVEEIKVTVPSAITSANGKYFKLTGVPDTSAKRKCRIKIDYRTLRNDYEVQVNGRETDDMYNGGGTTGEKDAFNQYQEHKAKHEVLNTQTSYSKTNSNVQLPPGEFKRVQCDESYEVSLGTYAYLSPDETDACGKNGTTEKCDCTPDPVTKTCKCTAYRNQDHYKNEAPSSTCSIPTTIYELHANEGSEIKCTGSAGSTTGAGSCSKPFFKVKTWDKFPFTTGTFNGLKIEKDSEHNYSHAQYTGKIESHGTCDTVKDDFTRLQANDRWYVTSWDINWKRITFTGDFYGSIGKTCGSIAGGGDCPDRERQNEENSAKSAQTAFNNAKGKAQRLESIGKGCEGFMAYDTTTYHLTPSGNFHYMQVFLNGQKEKTGEVQTIIIGGNDCATTKSKIAEKTSSLIGGGGTEGDFKDIWQKKLNWDAAMLKAQYLSETYFNDTPVSFERKVTEDYKYEVASCPLPDPPANTKYTLYPGPQVSSTVTGYKSTGHGHQYQLYLTTYQGSFQTWWDMDGLGLTQRTKDKFKQLMNQNGSTCAEQGSALSKGDAESLKSANTKVPFTCQLNVRLGGMRIGSCSNGVDASLPCENPKEINNLYEFKVVDPKDIFPQGTVYQGEQYARNWRKGSTGEGDWGKTYHEIRNIALQDKTYSPEYLTYSYKLNTTALNTIKRYNKNHSYESFNNTMSCTCSGDEDDGCGLIRSPGNPTPGGSCGGGTTWNTRCRKCLSTGFLVSVANSYWNHSGETLGSIRNNSNVHWA